MKFGKRLLELVNPEWSDHYLAYKSLKKDLKHLTSQRMSDSSAAEGAFLTALLGSIHQVRDVCVCAWRYELRAAPHPPALFRRTPSLPPWCMRFSETCGWLLDCRLLGVGI